MELLFPFLVAFENIIDCTPNIVNIALNVAKRNVISALENGNYGGDILKNVAKSFENFSEPFLSMRTNYWQKSYIRKIVNYVEIKKILLGKSFKTNLEKFGRL